MSGEKEIRGPLSEDELNMKYGSWDTVFELNRALLASQKRVALLEGILIRTPAELHRVSTRVKEMGFNG